MIKEGIFHYNTRIAVCAQLGNVLLIWLLKAFMRTDHKLKCKKTVNFSESSCAFGICACKKPLINCWWNQPLICLIQSTSTQFKDIYMTCKKPEWLALSQKAFNPEVSINFFLVLNPELCTYFFQTNPKFLPRLIVIPFTIKHI